MEDSSTGFAKVEGIDFTGYGGTERLKILEPFIEMLEGALAPFRGTVILVSHDRRLLTKVADRVIELDDGVS